MKGVYQLLMQSANRNPDKVAVKFENQNISYQHFLLMVDQTAEYLLENNYANKKILLAMPRNIDLLISIFAILKVNSAYIPIDLTYPADRINYIINDCSCECVLTTGSNKDLFPDLDLICFEDTLNHQLKRNYSIYCKSLDSSLAYILYTSGSTGKPKGVMIEEISLINFIEAMGSSIDFDYKKTIICLTTISFDIFFLESIMALSKGLTVVLANEKEQNNAKLVKNLINEYHVDIIQLTPSRARQLISYSKDIFKNVSDIIIGGEDFPINLLKDIQANTTAKIYNVYGPTEATVWSTICDVTEKNEVFIGKALPGYETYVLDEDLKTVPTGEIGELCISGVSLSLGYLNKETLTAQKFVTVEGVKIYRTGDYVKEQVDGNLKYVGRMDNQVKIRGYRVELEEIESVAYLSGLISQTAVIVRIINDISSLELYYCSEHQNVTEQLKTYLRNNLPDYMVPSRFIELEAMPQTLNGKINRNMLVETYVDNMRSEIIREEEFTIESSIQEDDNLYCQVLEIIKTTTELNYITPKSEIEQIDSIAFIKIIVEIENTFDIVLSEETLMNSYFSTVSDLIQYVLGEVYQEKSTVDSI